MKSLVKKFLLLTLPMLLLLEVFFRIGIPASSMPEAYFDEDYRLMRFTGSGEEGLYTIGPLALQRGRWRVNNYGWNSTIDYDSEKHRERIAVIGDSYIRAVEVDHDKCYPALLRGWLGDLVYVYSFGFAGAPLSQYLQMSRYVARVFDPDIFIFNVVHNDFAESILSLNQQDNYWLTVSITNDGVIENKPHADYTAARFNPKKMLVKRTINRSALFRYILQNLEWKKRIKSWLTSFIDETYNANIDIKQVRDHEPLIQLATRYVIGKLKEENPGRRVVVVMDGPRKDIHQKNLKQSNVLFLHDIMKQSCAEFGVEFLDLTMPMMDDFEKNGVWFNSDIEGHWNEYGHEFVGRKVLNYLTATNASKDRRDVL